ncbi:unnamed protein product [Cyclocybe aegerita]|uniref:Uncharacterized protein n=1 Tax=Cyclocybe aegerita TaxID=1973307 RepID=A0A8S0WU09_CYCAE|nr:unnamed protein product [Cyclocybe aegerita]
MSAQRFALPPGVYHVQTTESPARNVVNPGTDGQQLFVASPSGADDQKASRTGFRIVLALLLNLMNAVADLRRRHHEGPQRQAITRATSGVEWIISVEWDEGSNSYKGPIMANDSSKRRFSLNGNNIELAAASSSQEWVFVAA